MKKVLYISNIEVPYRTRFFNELAKNCDLTVLYERKKSSNRNSKWVATEKSKFKVEYLEGINIKNEFSFSFKIHKYILGKFDMVIFGCCNSPVQMYGIQLLKLFRKKYYINLDGEYFFDDKNIKGFIKRFFAKGASGYFIAGEKSAKKLEYTLKTRNIYPYYFSSMSMDEIKINSKDFLEHNKGDYILVVGQYFDYKGLDIALDVAKELNNIKFKFVGMSSRADLFKELVKEKELKNVEVIPFLDKESLYKEYKECKLLLLTSRRECWGLVINEAASFGCPIIASKYAGAAVEFLEDNYGKFLVDPYNIKNIIKAIDNLTKKEIFNYKKELIKKSKSYCIEKNVETFLTVIEGDNDEKKHNI